MLARKRPDGTPHSRRMTMRQLLLGLIEAPPPTFDNFVTGRNGPALAALHALGGAGLTEPCVYIWGVAGSGRSHLLAAWSARMRRDGAREFHAIDDADALADDAQGALFTLYNRAREGAATLLVAGSHSPAQLDLRDDLKSRLAWGLSFEIRALSDDEKRAALIERAAGLGMLLTLEMCDYLFARARRDMPSLIALVDALDRHSLETRRPVTLPLLRELLNQNHNLPL